MQIVAFVLTSLLCFASASAQSAAKSELENCHKNLNISNQTLQSLKSHKESAISRIQFERAQKLQELQTLQRKINNLANNKTKLETQLSNEQSAKTKLKKQHAAAKSEVSKKQVDINNARQRLVAATEWKDELTYLNIQTSNIVKKRLSDCKKLNKIIVNHQKVNRDLWSKVETERAAAAAQEATIESALMTLVATNADVLNLINLNEDLRRSLTDNQIERMKLQQQRSRLLALCQNNVPPDPAAVCRFQNYSMLQECKLDVAAKNTRVDLQIAEFAELDTETHDLQCLMNKSMENFRTCGSRMRHCEALLSEQQKVVENRRHETDADARAAMELQGEFSEAKKDKNVKRGLEHMIEALTKVEQTVFYNFEPDFIPRPYFLAYSEFTMQAVKFLCDHSTVSCPSGQFCGLRSFAQLFRHSKIKIMDLSKRMTVALGGEKIEVFFGKRMSILSGGLVSMAPPADGKAGAELSLEDLTKGRRLTSMKEIFEQENFEFLNALDLLWVVKTPDEHGWLGFGPPERIFLESMRELLVQRGKTSAEARKYVSCRCLRGIAESQCKLAEE